ncbi:MAG: DedA family protein/thiosulfate sulfurtransferase GlpE [Rubrivivax sp.]
MDFLLLLIADYGLWLVFANVLALQLGLPLPAYPTLIVVGAAAAARPGNGVAQLTVVAVAVLACLLADSLWYAAGGRYGRKVLWLMCRLSLSPDTCVRQTETLYERWGAPSLVVAKFIPGFGAVATSMAGLARTPLATFVIFDALGALLWAGVAVLLGHLFRDAVTELIEVFEAAGRWGLIGLGSTLLLTIAVKALQRHRLIRTLRMARIDVDELAAMLQRGERPLVVDVRSSTSRSEGRIPGAVWIDNQAFDASLRALGIGAGDERLRNDVIVYCACPNEASAAIVAQKLMRAGFKHVRPLGGGIEAWIDRGHALQSSD